MLRLFRSAVMAVSVFFSSSASASAVWSRADAQQLVEYVGQIATEGLDPADYRSDQLQADLASPSEGWQARMTDAFLHLAADLRQGHVRNRAGLAWNIIGGMLSEEERLQLLDEALSNHRVRATLEGLAPQNREYRQLKAALAATSPNDRAALLRLRANLERWRWMPRELGSRYLLVNVPAFTVTLMENGAAVVRRRVIVGKPGTPTPQFSATVTGVVFNPWWDVPDSIVRESVGKIVRSQPALARQRGYVVQGGRYRQRPGPLNALGQAKLVMANPYRVYLHDTPSRKLFDESVRAFSHGCIRTQDILGLAQDLLDGTPGWDRTEIDRAVANGATVQADLNRPIPIYVAYFTAMVEQDGSVSAFPDIYKRDELIVSQLVDREPS